MDIKNHKFAVYPLINGLSDHDAQIMELENTHNINNKTYTAPIRKIYCNTIKCFMDALSQETGKKYFRASMLTEFLINFLILI
jgi:flagellar biosynthesis regulator FlbT